MIKIIKNEKITQKLVHRGKKKEKREKKERTRKRQKKYRKKGKKGIENKEIGKEKEREKGKD